MAPLRPALPGIAREAGWIAAHLVDLPAGRAARLGGRTLRRRGNASAVGQRGLLRHDPRAATTPILLVHGIVDNHSIFTRLDHACAAAASPPSPPTTTACSPPTSRGRGGARGDGDAGSRRRPGTTASTWSGTASAACWRAGSSRARAATRRCDTLVTLGTPHGGTELARLAPLVPLLRMARELSPGSRVVAGPGRAGAGLPDPLRGVRERHRPPGPAQLERAASSTPTWTSRNVDVHGVGHLSMPNHRALAYEIADLLAAGRAAGDTRSRIGHEPRARPRAHLELRASKSGPALRWAAAGSPSTPPSRCSSKGA